jgi:hypothetical protein
MGMWTNSNRAQMGSNVLTDQYQGGGNIKTGFPYIIGRTQWSSIAIKDHPLTYYSFRLNLQPFPTTEYLPIGTNVEIRMR